MNTSPVHPIRSCLMTCLAAGVLAGCTKLKEADPPQADQPQAERRGPVAPGMAPFDIGAEFQPAVGGGGAAPPVPPPQAPPQAAGEPAGDQSLIGRTTNHVVDYRQALLENPNLVESEGRVRGDDPLTIAASAYVSQRARASLFGFQRALQLYREEHDRNPTYEEFLRMMQENRIEFTMLYPWQMYAYDAQEGIIVILEDPEEKARRRR